MDFSNIKSLIPDYARDLKLNLSNVLTPEGAPGLNQQQILAAAVAASAASRNETLLREVEALAAEHLDAGHLQAAKAAASVMGMNNVYYRFTHLVGNGEYAKLPAKLRMNVLGNPGIGKTDFELYSLVVSAINGCGACMAAHERAVRGAGISAEGVQSAVRIGAVVHGIAVALEARPRESEGRQAA